MSELRALLLRTAERIADYRESVSESRVFPQADIDGVRAALGGPLPDPPTPAARVLDDLVAAVSPALVATTGPRYFGFVIGGASNAATAADLLTTGWDQHAFQAVSSPAAAIVEEVASGWLTDLLGLPATASVGFVTGAQAANTVGLAAARHHVLAAVGWDVERDGLIGAPPLRVVASVERHATIDRALRLLGLGAAIVEGVPADRNGAIDVAALSSVLADGPASPTIVCLQAGNVNTGACDDLTAACAVSHRHDAWVHVDGAFGLWASASPALRHLVAGIDTADSWACDGHKWLNVPYDCGYAICAHPTDHAASMHLTAAYLLDQGGSGVRNPSDFVPESSRRARGFATWAALRELGRDGVAELVDRCCRLARRFAFELASAEGVEVVNEVVLNQVLVRFGDDARTEKVIDAIQRGGTCWMGGTTWHGQRLMRISVSNWTTTEADVDRSVEAILDAARSC
jgi:glutamate/tyrosine decarboxylase-like PLP-dependent enzyme